MMPIGRRTGLDFGGFVGVAVHVSCTGRVRGISGKHLGLLAKLSTDGVRLHEVLGLDERQAAAVALRLWLAAVAGADDAEWEWRVDEPPDKIPAPNDPGDLILSYWPVLTNGLVTSVVVCVETPDLRDAALRSRLGVGMFDDDDDRDASSMRMVCVAGVMRVRRSRRVLRETMN